MGEHLLSLLTSRNDVEVTCAVRRPSRQSELQQKFERFKFVSSNLDAVQNANVLIFAVKPNQIRDVCDEIAPSVTMPVLSVAAAVPLQSYCTWLPAASSVTRCMPSITCQYNGSTIPYRSSTGLATTIYQVYGPQTLVLAMADDASMDMATVMYGCAPAFYAWYYTVLQSVGDMKLPPEIVDQLLRTSMADTAMLLNTESPATIMQRVASPGGATEAALTALTDCEKPITKAMQDAMDRISSIRNKIE